MSDPALVLPSCLELPLPFLTEAGEPLGGSLKETPEDFQVEEIPAYEPCGEGEHLFLWIEKRGLSSEEMSRRLARVCGISVNDIGMAGMKDRQGITRQYLSVPANCSSKVLEAQSEELKILRSGRHTNKLRIGHLRGNQFEIRLRGARNNPELAARVADQIRETGFPNYYGDQRFGSGRENLVRGLGLLNGSFSPRKIPFAKRKFLLRLYLSAVQSALFNRALADRIEQKTVRTVQRGDVLQVVQSGGPFVSTDPETDQPRLLAGEVTISGPMFGPNMKSPAEETAQQEALILQECGLSPEVWTRFPQLTSGTRRPYLIPPANLEIEQENPATFLFKFGLPAGAYATSLLREFQQGDRVE